MSIEKARRELGYEPKVSLEDGLKRTISSMRVEMGKS
jgi:nucleoside-diphosphate-sugar epimerase